MKNIPLHSKRDLVSVVVMLLALGWLTISLPFVNAAQQQVSAVSFHKTTHSVPSSEKDHDNPLTNTIEEKNESGVNTLSEYLHEPQISDAPATIPVNFYKCHPSDLYYAFHPELLSPPPELLS